MYRCENCGAKFDEPNSQLMSYERYYGIEGGGHYFTLETCPNCHSEDVEIITYCDIEEDCRDCPRYGDDCDGNFDDEEEEDDE